MKRNYEFNECESTYFGLEHSVCMGIRYEGWKKLISAYFDENITNAEVLALYDGYGIMLTDFESFDENLYEEVGEEEYETKYGENGILIDEVMKWVIVMESKNLDTMYNKEYAGKRKKELFDRLKNMVG